MKYSRNCFSLFICFIVFFSIAQELSGASQGKIVIHSSVPTAVPLLTHEEAEKANQEAFNAQIYQETTAITNHREKIIANAPAAVPILSPEEAVIANKNAIALRKSELQKIKHINFLKQIGITRNTLSLLIALMPLLFICDVLCLFDVL